MTSAFGKMFTLSRNYGQLGRDVWRQVKFHDNPQRQFPWYRQALSRYSEAMLIERRIDRAAVPYYNHTLMSHLWRHLPNWRGFQTEYRTYAQAQWTPIFQDWDWSTVRIVVDQEQPLLQRDRLMQIFGACPPGSYGYYAQYGLAPFKAVVGSFASATIDEFFASHVQYLKQPFSEQVNDIMSTLETVYWNGRQDLVDWLAGQSFGKVGRELAVAIPANLMTLWEGRRVPAIPEGEALSEAQLAVAQTTLTAENLERLDDAARVGYAAELYQQLVERGRARPGG